VSSCIMRRMPRRMNMTKTNLGLAVSIFTFRALTSATAYADDNSRNALTLVQRNLGDGMTIPQIAPGDVPTPAGKAFLAAATPPPCIAVPSWPGCTGPKPPPRQQPPNQGGGNSNDGGTTSSNCPQGSHSTGFGCAQDGGSAGGPDTGGSGGNAGTVSDGNNQSPLKPSCFVKPDGDGGFVVAYVANLTPVSGKKHKSERDAEWELFRVLGPDGTCDPMGIDSHDEPSGKSAPLPKRSGISEPGWDQFRLKCVEKDTGSGEYVKDEDRSKCSVVVKWLGAGGVGFCFASDPDDGFDLFTIKPELCKYAGIGGTLQSCRSSPASCKPVEEDFANE